MQLEISVSVISLVTYLSNLFLNANLDISMFHSYMFSPSIICPSDTHRSINITYTQ